MKLTDLQDRIISDAMKSPQLARGRVWCLECGRTQKVHSADCLRHGWPLCCGYTMSISSPEEIAFLQSEGEKR